MNRVEIISASAGTGKTARLARLIHEAVADKSARPEAVLATTFTNRAAAELAERARETLLQVGETHAAHRLHAARVGTVNSVCGRIVHDFAFLHGLSPRVSVLDDRTAAGEPLRAGSEALPRELLNELEDLHTRMGLVGFHPGGFAAPGEWDWKRDVTRIVNLARSNAIGVEQFPEFIERSTEGLLAFLQPPTADGEVLDRGLEEALRQFLDDVDLKVDTTKKTRDECQRGQSALSRGVRNLPWSDWASLAQLNTGAKSRSQADPVREAAGAHDRHPRLREDLRRAVQAVFDAAAYVLEAYQEHKRGLGVIDFVDQETEALQLLKLDRLSRTTRHVLDLVDAARSQGWRLISVGEHLDTGTASGRLVATVLAALAQMEREQVSERTRLALDRIAREGRGRSRFVPFGYRTQANPERTTLAAGDRSVLMPHAGEQAILARMLALRDGGLGPRRIARVLNEEALQNPRTSAPWSFGQVQGILRTVDRREAVLAETG